jgi:hypothetical protein
MIIQHACYSEDGGNAFLEMLVDIYQSTRLHAPENNNIYKYMYILNASNDGV